MYSYSVIYTEITTLEQDLGVTAKALYTLSNEKSKHYKKVLIPKKGNNFRRLFVPDEFLKRVQRLIYEKILSYIPVSESAMAYCYGKNIKSNAKVHTGKRNILKLDILNFFDSISYAKLKQKVFREEYFSEPISTLLSNLCCYNDGVPQGAPTSPAIANIVLRDFDCCVAEWCKKRDIAYTRYCDDLTFSSDESLDGVIDFIKEELRKENFLLNYKKTALVNSDRRQTVTGLVVNSRVRVLSEYRKKIRQEVYYCKKFGVKSHFKRSGEGRGIRSCLHCLEGRINYVLSIEPENKEMQGYKKWIKQEFSNLLLI